MRIMVVDDEPLIGQYIVRCIRDADAEAEVIGAVTSGAKALRLLEETPVDLVFADITMPKMDGLELLRRIKQRDPAVEVVMLTCHDEFEYARTAIQNRASNYILKNEVSEERLRAVLDEIKARQRQRHAEGAVIQIDRSKYLRRLVEQDVGILPIRKSDLRDNHIYLNDRAFLVVLFHNEEQDIQLIRRCLQEGFEDPLFYAYSAQEMFLLVNVRRGGSSETAAQPFREVEHRLHGPLGCSRLHQSIEMLQTAFEEAVRDGSARFYGASPVGFSIESGVERVQASIMRATVRLEERAFNEGCAEIERLLAEAGTHHIRVGFLKEALQQLFVGVQRKLGLDMQRVEQGIGQSRTFDALCASVSEGLKLLRGQGRTYSDAIRKAVDHIDRHYAEDISLNAVADLVYLNRDYLSRQFKREVGINFSEYLMDVRMKHARQLLETTNMRISDVALSVGITNMSYFSTAFHKFFGCAPNEVRKRKRSI